MLHIYLTDSLWRRQSQQSFNTLIPFNFLFYSLHVSAPTAIFKWDIQLVIISVFEELFQYNGSVARMQLDYRDDICGLRFFNL
jgi:hypothetical protein